MLCTGSHHPSATWQLLPTGTVEDAPPATPQPQLNTPDPSVLLAATILS